MRTEDSPLARRSVGMHPAFLYEFFWPRIPSSLSTQAEAEETAGEKKAPTQRPSAVGAKGF